MTKEKIKAVIGGSTGAFTVVDRGRHGITADELIDTLVELLCPEHAPVDAPPAPQSDDNPKVRAEQIVTSITGFDRLGNTPTVVISPEPFTGIQSMSVHCGGLTNKETLAELRKIFIWSMQKYADEVLDRAIEKIDKIPHPLQSSYVVASHVATALDSLKSSTLKS